MSKVLFAIKCLAILVGLFIILMSFDTFSMTEFTLLERIGGFFINASPGIIIIIIVLLLWRRDFYLGVFLILCMIVFFFLFKFYRETNEKWLTIVTIEGPLLIGGILLMLPKKKPTIVNK